MTFSGGFCLVSWFWCSCTAVSSPSFTSDKRWLSVTHPSHFLPFWQLVVECNQILSLYLCVLYIFCSIAKMQQYLVSLKSVIFVLSVSENSITVNHWPATRYWPWVLILFILQTFITENENLLITSWQHKNTHEWPCSSGHEIADSDKPRHMRQLAMCDLV